MSDLHKEPTAAIGDVVELGGEVVIPGGQKQEAPLGRWRVLGFFGYWARIIPEADADSDQESWRAWPVDQLEKVS